MKTGAVVGIVAAVVVVGGIGVLVLSKKAGATPPVTSGGGKPGTYNISQFTWTQASNPLIGNPTRPASALDAGTVNVLTQYLAAVNAGAQTIAGGEKTSDIYNQLIQTAQNDGATWSPNIPQPPAAKTATGGTGSTGSISLGTILTDATTIFALV